MERGEIRQVMRKSEMRGIGKYIGSYELRVTGPHGIFYK